jgi:large subunit ribosomal protein L7/L12
VEKEALIEALSKLTVLEMSELKTALEEKWGVKAAAAAVAVAAAAPEAAAAEEESTDFEVTLSEVPASAKIATIKAIRAITGLGLKEAKTMVESAPKVVKESAPKADAEEIVKKITDAGSKAAMKGI